MTTHDGPSMETTTDVLRARAQQREPLGRPYAFSLAGHAVLVALIAVQLDEKRVTRRAARSGLGLGLGLGSDPDPHPNPNQARGWRGGRGGAGVRAEDTGAGRLAVGYCEAEAGVATLP